MRREINTQTGQETLHDDAPFTPQIPPTAQEILAGKQAKYDAALDSPTYGAIVEAVADAVTAGVSIDAATLRANGRDKIR